jgi:protein involved in polysaccharide export with SLBB domain
VPPLGGAVAVGGEVTRPGIYELPAGAASAPLSAVLALAGQPLRPAGNRFVLDTTDGAGRRSLHEIGPRDALRRGDALRVEPGTDVAAGRIRLAGHVAAPLTRAAGGGRGGSLRALLSDPRLVRPDPYPRLGVGAAHGRADARAPLPALRPRPRAARRRRPALGRGRRGGLLAKPTCCGCPAPACSRRCAATSAAARRSRSNPLPTAAVQAPAPPPPRPRRRGLPGLGRARRRRAGVARALRPRPERRLPRHRPPPLPPVFVEYPALLPFALDQAVMLTGEVGLPGLYPITGDTGLDAVLAAAGGAADTADLSTVELSREPAENTGTLPLSRLTLDLRSRNFAAVRLSPRDAVRLPRGFADRDTGPVTLSGEFLRPGSYDIRRGERLSEVIARAGGLTPRPTPTARCSRARACARGSRKASNAAPARWNRG